MAKKTYPPLEEGWQTGSMISKGTGGDKQYRDKSIRELRDTLISDIAKKYTSGNQEEATALVEHHLIGMRQPSRGKPAMAASPEAQRLLPIYPPLEEGWQTANMREKERKGSRPTHRDRMLELREELIGDIMEQYTGHDREDAEMLTDDHLIGMRQTTRKAAWAASPDAQRLLDEKWGERSRRDQPPKER